WRRGLRHYLRRRRSPRFCLDRRFEGNLLRHPPALDQTADRRSQKGLERCHALPRRRTRRRSFPDHAGGSPGPQRRPRFRFKTDPRRLAFLTESVSERQEKMEDIDLYLVNLAGQAPEATPIRLTRNEAVELNLEWSPDNRHLFFQVNLGSLEKKYEDPQPRLYWIDAEADVNHTSGAAPEKRQPQRWFADYPGEVVHYAPLPDGSVLCACRQGTEVQFLTQATPKAAILKLEGWPGTYEAPAAAKQSQSKRLAFAYSSTERPTEVYLADSLDQLAQARPITKFNQ